MNHMLMNTDHHDQLITSLIRRMIFQIAPHEMKMFQGQKEEYLRDPQQIINKRGYSDEKTGCPDILFLAPIVRKILVDIVTFLEEEIDPNSASSPRATPPVSLSPAQMKKLYDYAYDKAYHYQLSSLKAHRVADAVVDSLTSAKGPCRR